MRNYRLAVLECDTPVPPVLEKLGPYGTIFEDFVRRGLQAYRQEDGVDGASNDINLEVVASNMVDLGTLPDPNEVDCLMLTGSSEFPQAHSFHMLVMTDMFPVTRTQCVRGS